MLRCVPKKVVKLVVAIGIPLRYFDLRSHNFCLTLSESLRDRYDDNQVKRLRWIFSSTER